MDITPATREQLEYDFKVSFPEFDEAYVTSNIDGIIDYVSCLLGDYDLTNECDKRIVLYLLAHEMKLNENNTYSGNGGNPSRLMTSKTVRDVSVSYGDSALFSKEGAAGLGQQYLFTTLYGQRAWLLRRKYACGVLFR